LKSAVGIQLLFATILVAAGAWARGSDPISGARTPLLVELFTSEGCSSCPAADVYLQQLDRQPIAGAEMIVLSEHVDYWNHIGWKDPYSAKFFSDRQNAYALQLDLDSVYTPQMVVDGAIELNGSDVSQAKKAFAQVLRLQKIPVSLSSISVASGTNLHALLRTGPLAASFGLREADVYIAIALDHAESHVSHGENAGRTLAHTAVARSIARVGTILEGKSFSQEVRLTLEPGQDFRNLRVVAFIQALHQSRVLGATMELLSKSPGK